MDVVFIALIAFLVLVALGLVVGGGIFLVSRYRGGRNIQISMRFLLRLYMYVVIIVGLLLFTQGVSHLLRAGMAGVGGKDFSYRPVFVSIPGFEEIRTPKPVELKERSDLTDEEREELAQIIAERERKNLELRREQRRKGLDRAFKEGLIQGVSFTIIGAIIWIVHAIGRRRLETHEERESPLNKIYLIVIVVTFGVITIVNLPQAVFESLRFYLLDPVDEFTSRYQPGGKLALSIAALPVWIVYLMGAVRAVRRGS